MRIAIIGGTRGLGRALAQEYALTRAELLIVGRKDIVAPLELKRNFEFVPCDLSISVQTESLCQGLQAWNPDQTIYCAGGGPFGPFAEKQIKDHRWALEVTFFSALQVAHVLANKRRPLALIGSAICESRGEALGASYSSAKHALVGLYQSLRIEIPAWDLRLYSPGYMDTDLLPRHSFPRISGESILSAELIAKKIKTWLSNSSQHGAWWVDSQS